MLKKQSKVMTAVAVAAALVASACSAEVPAAGERGDKFPIADYPAETFDGLQGDLLWYDTSGGIVGEAREETYIDDFTELTGVPAQREFTDGTTTKLFNAVEQGGPVPWNMGQITNRDFFVAKAKGWLDPIDTSVVPVENLNDGQFDEFGVRHDLYGELMFWNTEAFPAGGQPTDISALLDTEKYPGKRCLPSTFEGLGEIVSQADGVDAADVYPIDTDRVFAALDKIKGDVVWWTQADVATANMLNGECTIGLTYSGRVYDAVVNQGLPLAATWDGSYISASYYVVPKGAENPEVGQAAISLILRDEQANLDFVKAMPYPIDLKTIPLESYAPEVQDWLAVGENAAQGVNSQGEFYAENPDLDAQFQEWLVR